MNFFERRKLKKTVRHMLHVAAHARHMRGDIAKPAEIEAVLAAEAQLTAAWKALDPQAFDAAADALNAAVEKIYPTNKDSGWRENVEVFAVALAIAMAFRTYLLQPFKIPTGSMMPTLCGIRFDDSAARNWYDNFPLNAGTRFLTGERYVEVKAGATGYLRAVADPQNPRYPTVLPDALSGPSDYPILNKLRMPRVIYHFVLGDLPPEECILYAIHDETTGKILSYCPISTKMRPVVGESGLVKKGTVIASGRVLAGDHIFVNRVAYNFEKPKRNDIFVFSTVDLHYSGVHTNDFYIKRLVGLPNDSLELANNTMRINGQDMTNMHGRILADASTMGVDVHGIGYEMPERLNAALAPGNQPLKLTASQYLPCGDNTRSSLDGRYFGPVEQERVIGPACFVYWPFGKRWGIPK